MKLQHQVGGHPNVTTDESGSLVIKPASPREVAFYQLLHSTQTSRVIPSAAAPGTGIGEDGAEETLIRRDHLLGNLKRFLPRFWGTLSVQQPDPSIPSQECIILSNLTTPYTRPNIIDIKLGTVLFDADDKSITEEKRVKMEEKARVRASGVVGAAITGFQAWDSEEGRYRMGERQTCGRLKPDELAGAFAQFTPSATTTTSTSPDPEQSTPIASHTTHILRILRALKSTLESLHALLQHLEIRFIGASLLVVYEGDPARLGDTWGAVDAGSGRGDGLDDDAVGGDRDDEDDDSDAEDPTTTPRKPRSFLSGIFNQFGTEKNDGTTGFGLLDSSPPPSPDKNERLPDADASDQRARPFSIRLIDFAHTRLVDGEGPDVGVLMGVATVLELVEGRIRELEAV